MNFLTFDDLHAMFIDSLNPDTIRTLSIRSREAFAQRLLPKELYILCRSASYSVTDIFTRYGEKISDDELNKYIQEVNDQSRTTMNYFFKNEKARKRYEEIAALLLKKNTATATYYSYSDCPYRIHIEKAWRSLLSGISTEESKVLYEKLSEHIEYITRNHENIRSRFQALLSSSTEECLTSLTLIASTYSYFENGFDTAETKVLRLIVLPNNEEADADISDIAQYKERAIVKAEQWLAKIDDLVSQIPDNTSYNTRCYNTCRDVLSLGFLEDPHLLGKANFILYRCHQYPPYVGTDADAANRYLSESYRYEYSEAIAEMNAIEKQHLIYHVQKATSPTEGVCILNCQNIYTAFYLRTIPDDTWMSELLEDDAYEQASRPGHKKYLFFSDDYKKNFTDTMKLLDSIRFEKTYYLIDEMEIYIRCREEVYGPLIDTAQNLMQGHIAKIYILDDEKFAAQYLLSHHPLFYPIRSFTERATTQRPPLLNFVVIGSDECAEWLVREASWLMTFLPYEVSTKITIIAPDAERLYTNIVTKCPGLRKDNDNVAHLFKEKVICDIEYRQTKLSTCELENAIDRLFSIESYLYFAVSLGSDEDNLEMSIRVREQLIRNAIFGKPGSYNSVFEAKSSLYNLPPIAFRCRDSDIAELSKHLVVSNVQFGDRWYNNYALIPFGSYDTRYTWDHLDGGIIQKYALCVHMEYNNIACETAGIDEDSSYKEERQAAIDSFYSRQYNKDSSTAVALSLPYRLFNMYDKDGHLALPSWNILKNQAYFNEEVLSGFVERAKKFSYLEDNDATIIRLSEWEQLRWSRYMLARGWLPVSTGQTKIYVNSEYAKHQLYIAKLHPAICDFESLKKVEQELGKSFQQYNIRNLKNTHLILEMNWPEHELQRNEAEHELTHS